MNILVTGGLGFIGTNLCNALLAEGHCIRIIDRENPLHALNSKCEVIKVDFTSIDSYEYILRDIDTVYHLISTTVPGTSNKDKEFDITSNVCGTLKLLDACVKNEVKKVIFLSSGGTVYGQGKNRANLESDATNPICSYGIQKLTIEKYLYLYQQVYHLDYQVVRLSNPYGVTQHTKNGQGVIPIFIEKIKKQEAIEIWGNEQITRDYIHIDDTIRALVKLVYYKGDKKILNLGTGVGTSLIEIIQIIENELDIKANIKVLPSRGIDVQYNVLDIEEIKKELSWEPKINIETGIQHILKGI